MSNTKVAITQSNYIPWIGYFDLISSVDELVLYDDVQYTKRDWRNRNKIKTSNGVLWLSVPIMTKGRYYQKICEATIDKTDWQIRHWKTIEKNYGKAPYKNEILTLLEPIYLNKNWNNLSKLNFNLIQVVKEYLDIDTRITWSRDYTSCEDRNERLASIVEDLGGDEYVSGPAAKQYLDNSCFKKKSIKVTWFKYNMFPEYPQLWGPFVNDLSVVDLLMNTGPNAKGFLSNAKS